MWVDDWIWSIDTNTVFMCTNVEGTDNYASNRCSAACFQIVFISLINIASTVEYIDNPQAISIEPDAMSIGILLDLVRLFNFVE